VRDHALCGRLTVNQMMPHAAVMELPFGVVGKSGVGVLHGRSAFDTLCHRKGVTIVPTVDEFEANMAEMRYEAGDRERKYRILKQMEGKLE